MKTTKKILALILVVVSILSCMILPASAATTSSGTSTCTITVITQANWSYPGGESITLSQSKGTFSYSKTNWYGKETGKSKTKNEYGTWKITDSATDGSHTFSKTWKDGSIKLSLNANKTYKITIIYDGMQDVFKGA